jgi:hypothetical protein
MSNFRSAYDLKNGILRRSGELTDGTSPYDSIAIEYANGIYQSILAGASEFDLDLGQPWIWAKSKYPAILTLEVPYSDDAVDLTNGSATGAFTVAPIDSQAGKYLKLDDRPEVMRIVSHAAGATAFTIDVAYNNETITNATYKAIKLDYDLTSGIQRLIGPMSVFADQSLGEDRDFVVSELDSQVMKKKFPIQSVTEGIPTTFSQIYEVDGTITVRFNQYVNKATRLEYDYIPIQSDLIVKSFTDSAVSAGSDTITISGHGFQNGDQIQLTTSGTLPTGLSVDTLYFVVSASATTFKLSLTSGGTAIDITAASGGGTHYVSTVPVLPREARVAIEYAATYWVMMDKNDDRSTSFLQLAQAKLRALIEASRKERQMASKDRGRLVPRPELNGHQRLFFAGGGSNN